MNNAIKKLLDNPNGFPPSKELHKSLPSLTANTLLTFIQQWYQDNEETLAISGKNLCSILSMSENQLRRSKKLLKEKGYIRTKLVGHPSISSYILGGESMDKRMDNHTEDSGLSILSENHTITKTPRGKRRNSAKNEVYPSCEISDNILITILNKDKILSELNKNKKYKELYEKFGTRIELDLSCLLYDEIVITRPGYFDWRLHSDKCAIAKIILNWCVDIDKLIRKDGRCPELVLDVILWCQRNDFWAQNIKSAEKLRKQFPKLHEQMDKDQNIGICRTRDIYPEITKELITLFIKDFLAGRKVEWSVQDKEKFIKAAVLVVKFAKEGKLMQNNVPGYLIQCLNINYADEEKAVIPGHLCSSRTWDVLMPQYLRELGVIYSA